jgi:hypothetical protein
MDMKGYRLLIFSLLLFFSCDNAIEEKFDAPSDVRVEEAIRELKLDLTFPAYGWKMRYTPDAAYGSYYVFLKFSEDNKVHIQTDFQAEDGAYLDHTVNYRIDSSLGLELIFANYSFFSFLFELDDASFPAEFEFIYANKTPEGALVFVSKSDKTNPTRILLEPASANEAASLLSNTLATSLKELSSDLKSITKSMTITYPDKDITLNLTVNEMVRTITIHSAVNTLTDAIQPIGIVSPYVLKSDSLVFLNPLSETYFNKAIALKALALTAADVDEITICDDPLIFHSYAGKTQLNESIILSSTLYNAEGASITTQSDFYATPIQYIYNNNRTVYYDIIEDLKGVNSLQLYYNYQLGSGEVLNALGFYLSNASGNPTFALHEFTPVINGNQITFNFKPTISLFGDQNPDADIANISNYLTPLTANGTTFVFRYSDDIFEIYNPCTGWNTVLFAQ